METCKTRWPSQAVGQEAALRITHRLDTCTEGVLVLGKTAGFVKAFNRCRPPFRRQAAGGSRRYSVACHVHDYSTICCG